MLASLALVKDATGWAMVPLSAALVECARRQWQRARIASERDENWDPGLREYDWKNGTVMSQMPGDGGPAEAYELEPVPKFGRRAAYSTKFATETKVIEMGSPPTRRGTVGKQGDPFRPLNVGMGYESRI